MKNKKNDFTIKNGDKEVHLTVAKPTYDDIAEADNCYAIKVGSLLKSATGRKLLLRDQLEDYLKESGVWTEEDDRRVGEIEDEIDARFVQLRRGGIKRSEGRRLAVEISQLRRESTEIRSKRRTFDEATVEHIAEQEKMDYLVYACTVDPETRERYWNSFDDMKHDKDGQVYAMALTRLYSVVYGIDEQFEKNLPENKWLLKHGLVDENLRFVDPKSGQFVDIDGNPVEDIEETIKRRFDNLQGEIVEEQPFIDDETNEPIIISSDDETDKKEEKVEENKENV